MKFFGEVSHGPRTKWLDFGGDSDRDADAGNFYASFTMCGQKVNVTVE